MLSRIKNLIKISFKLILELLNPQNRQFSFHIYEFEFEVDENGKTWMMGLNDNPTLKEDSKVLKMILPRMIDDALSITLDKVFDPAKKWGHETKFRVDGYSDEDNLWTSLR